MKQTGKAPFTLGMEIEQIGYKLPRGYNSGDLKWKADGSGPMEATLGGPKTAAAILKKFYAETRDSCGTWEWHAASARSGRADGCGSHVHLGLASGVFEDDLVANTIAYNTVVEMTPFFAPFWCHDWERGFRHGTQYGGTFAAAQGESNINAWAVPQTTRVSPSTMRRVLRGSRPPGARSNYPSIRANRAVNSENKPFTIENRMNDAHPGVALTGLLAMRRIAGQAIERGESIKLENRNAVLSDLYRAIYVDAARDGLMTAMKRPLPSGTIRFEAGRGIPRVDALEFETPFDVLKAVLRPFSVVAGTFGYRVKRLVLTGDDANSPANNADALWNLDAEYGTFAWENGPEDKGYVAPDAEIEAETEAGEVVA